MIELYPFLTLTCIFIVLLFVSSILYKIKINKFNQKNYVKSSLNEHPLYLIFPIEKKINKFSYSLYIIGLLFFSAGLFIIFSNSSLTIDTILFGIFLQVLAAIISLIVTINYFRVIKKEQSAVQKWTTSNHSEKKKIMVIPSNIIIYKKIGYISFLFSEVFFIISIITESGLL